MKFRVIIFLSVSLFYFTKTGLSQITGTPPAGLSFQNFTSEDGLSDNFINRIYQDSRGFIWISTPEGLNRFDGSTFKKFYAGKQPGNSLPSNLVGVVFEYKKDHLLVATNNGVVTMNTIDQEFYFPLDSTLASVIVHDFFIETRNKIWLCLTDGLLQIDSSLEIKKNLRNYPGVGGIYKIHRLIDGRLIFLSSGGYFFLDEDNDSITPLSKVIKDVAGIKGNYFSYYDYPTNSIYTTIWGNGLYQIDLNENKLRSIPGLVHINSVMRNSRGNIWIGSSSGLSFFDEKNNRFTTYSKLSDENSSLVYNVVWFLFEDREKNLWIGTTDGLSKLNNSALSLSYFRNEFEINGSSAEIYDVTKGGNGKIYIATYGNGVFSIDSLHNIKNYGRDLIRRAWSVNKEGENILVTGHDKEIYRLHPYSGKMESLQILKPYRDTGDLVLFAYTDRSGGKWYSINGQMGLFYLKHGEKDFKHFSNKQSPPSFPHSYFNMAVEDQKERIWFGMNKRAEFVSYDFNSKKFSIHSLSNKVGISLSGVNCILADNNIIWVGTDGTGLIRYDPNSQAARIFTIEDGLSANNITSLVYDKQHRLWAGTRKGLNCLLPGQQRFISFTRSDGLPEVYFNDGVIYYDSIQNRLYAGARSTLVNFNPDEFLKSTAQVKPLHIEEILVNGKKISFSSLKELRLLYTQNNLQFTFIAIDFENPGSINYYYKLEGADKDWIGSGHQHSASYSNLSDGSYRFLVKAIKPGNKTEIASEVPFNIIIQPPYWRTIWFRGLVILAIASLLYALIRAYYLRQLEHQRIAFEKQQAIEQERTRIATDMHDDLGAGLSRIKFLSQALSNKKEGDEYIKTGLEKITAYSDEMTEKMGEIVWALNEKNDTLADLVAYTRSYALEYLANHNIPCEMDTPLHLPGTFITGETRQNIFLSVKECLHNIIKHAAATQVYFSIQLNGMIQIVIHDNGKGIDLNNRRAFSNGIQNIQQRMREMKGEVKFFNEKGTKVVLHIPFSL